MSARLPVRRTPMLAGSDGVERVAVGSGVAGDLLRSPAMNVYDRRIDLSIDAYGQSIFFDGENPVVHPQLKRDGFDRVPEKPSAPT